MVQWKLTGHRQECGGAWACPFAEKYSAHRQDGGRECAPRKLRAIDYEIEVESERLDCLTTSDTVHGTQLSDTEAGILLIWVYAEHSIEYSRREYDTDLAVINSGIAVSGIYSIELIAEMV